MLTTVWSLRSVHVGRGRVTGGNFCHVSESVPTVGKLTRVEGRDPCVNLVKQPAQMETQICRETHTCTKWSKCKSVHLHLITAGHLCVHDIV